MRAARRPLSPAWVAGSVRARQLLLRRIGREGARSLARCASLEDAVGVLEGSAYGRDVRPGLDLAAAQRAVGETALWHIRVLAGWAPPRALDALRALAAWFELANIEDRLAFVRGERIPAPFRLGGLAAAWPRAAAAQTVADVRAGLAGTAWGDPGTDDPGKLALALRLSWAERVLRAVEAAQAWVAGAVALLLARRFLLSGRAADAMLELRAPAIGTRWAGATSISSLRERLPSQAAWVLEGIDAPERLWEAELAWWRRVETDAEALARSPLLGRDALIGSVVLLGVDAWRAAAALEVAARGGGPAMEAFERIA